LATYADQETVFNTLGADILDNAFKGIKQGSLYLRNKVRNILPSQIVVALWIVTFCNVFKSGKGSATSSEHKFATS
jgi:hypothetical protein